MNLIRKLLVAGAVVYVGILLVQSLSEIPVQVQAAGAALLLFLGIIPVFLKDEHTAKRYEMAAIWICVLLFAAYAAITLGGALW
jgi:hypothetical protein